MNANDDIAYIIFNGPIDELRVKQAIGEIEGLLRKRDPKTLYMAMSSTGGSVHHALTFYSFLRSLPVSVITHNIAATDSCAITVYLAGDMRLTNSQTSFAFHPYRFTFLKHSEWRVKDLQEKVNSLRADEAKARAITVERTELSEKEAQELFTLEGIFLSPVAVHHKVAHRIEEFALPPGATFTQI